MALISTRDLGPEALTADDGTIVEGLVMVLSAAKAGRIEQVAEFASDSHAPARGPCHFTITGHARCQHIRICKKHLCTMENTSASHKQW